MASYALTAARDPPGGACCPDVVFREAALRALARVRSEDKAAFVRIRRAIAALADQPHPDGAMAWGGARIFRLHPGEARILHEVDEALTVYIINVGCIS